MLNNTIIPVYIFFTSKEKICTETGAISPLTAVEPVV